MNSPNTMALNGLRWVRSQDGLIAGVCEGLSRRTGMAPWVVRLLWVLSVLVFGTGALLYLILWWSFPREDRLAKAYANKIMGVCARLAEQTNIEVGVMRALALGSAFCSLGVTLILYVVLYFILPPKREVREEQKLIDTTAIRL